jgi:hypothetical protein
LADSSYNLIGDGTGMSGISNGELGNQVGTGASPIDPELGPLDDNCETCDKCCRLAA